MKKRLLDWVVCPACGERPRLQVFREEKVDLPAALRGRTLLDAGCGNGELTRSMAEYGLEVVGMDFSRSVEGARRRLVERLYEKTPPVAHRVHYLQGNVLELPLLPASFDFVHSSGVLHHTPSTERAFRSVSRALKPGGLLY